MDRTARTGQKGVKEVFMYETRVQKTRVEDGVLGESIEGVAQAEEFFRKQFDGLDREKCIMAMLNIRDRVVGFVVVGIGGLSDGVVDPRVIFRAALMANAAKFIIAHNHPSGEPTPSETDEKFFENLKKCGKLMCIPMVDFMIFGDGNVFSFYEKGYY